MGYPVIHVISMPDVGHVKNSYSHCAHDCWCEPQVYLEYDAKDRPVLIVDHNDHDPRFATMSTWITRALCDPSNYPSAPHREWPRMLPPHEEKGPDVPQ